MPRERKVEIKNLIHPNGSRYTNGMAAQGATREPPEVYRYSEHGREYYAFRNAAVYPFPCDEEENRRLDVFHCLIHDVALGKRLYNADLRPRKQRIQVLDVGYGTGIWAYEMAQKCPWADVIGIDLINNQPTRVDNIPNVAFRSPVDFTGPNWGFQENSFHFIRMSQLCGSVPDWLTQYRNVYRHLKPSAGWIEHIEIDWAPRTLHDQPFPAEARPLQAWWESMERASSLLHKPIKYPENVEALLNRAGFTDINHRTVRIPLQSHPVDTRDEELQRWYKAIMCYPDDDGNVPQAFEGLTLSLFTRQLGQTPASVQQLCNAVRATCTLNRLPLYHNIHIWSARKPG